MDFPRLMSGLSIANQLMVPRLTTAHRDRRKFRSTLQ